ncbi:MAG: hypothetical protein AAF449_20950 [Myxococcota bacterium]
MSLLKKGQAHPKVDEAVKKALGAYGRADPETRADVIHRLAVRMTPDQRRLLAARLAEVSLGHLWVLLDEEP